MDSPKLYAEQKHTLNQIQRTLNLDKMYLYRFVGNYDKIVKIPHNVLLAIAKVEGIGTEELYEKMLKYAAEK